mmetsp:Transcript_2166/g.5299  ORF Transcript_2166/g.5299 Transcript_2166/m.5299 type:complete len:306 (-) Transcript_2166:112-1029(-)
MKIKLSSLGIIILGLGAASSLYRIGHVVAESSSGEMSGGIGGSADASSVESSGPSARRNREGDCERHPKSKACQTKPIVRLASSDSSVTANCTYFYVRVPKTGSTSIHNTIVHDENARRLVCSQKKHVSIPNLDDKQYNVDTYLVSMRDPYERFASQYRYMYGNTAHASKALQLNFVARYPTINDLVSDLEYARYKFFRNAVYWMSMTHYVPLEWMQKNSHRIIFLCVSSNSTSLHEQLERTLGIDIAGLPNRHNPTGGMVHGKTSDFDVLSEKSKTILAEMFLEDDLELYGLSRCGGFARDNEE